MDGKETIGKGSSETERHEAAEEIRGWADGINRVRNSWAQRLPDVIGPLHDSIGAIEQRAQEIWPERIVTGSGTSGPPTAGHVTVSVESLPAMAEAGPQVVLNVRVSIDRGQGFEFRLPIRGAQPLIRAIAVHHDYWAEEWDAGA